MEENNMVNEFAEMAADEGMKVYDLAPTGTDFKTVGIVAGASFVAGVVFTKVAKPVFNKVKNWIGRKKANKDDFKVVDADVTEVEESEAK